MAKSGNPKNRGMNSTIEYYNKHAEEYFRITAQVELFQLYERFLEFIPAGGRIMDLGGSGRDIKWFRDHGYDAYGLDASEELVKVVKEQLCLPIEIGNIEDWITDEPFDGIWCCASLIHLKEEAVLSFFSNLNNNLKRGGVLFMSVKSGIETGTDETGRFFLDYNEATIKRMVQCNEALTLQQMWYTEDKMKRNTFRWLNAIIQLN